MAVTADDYIGIHQLLARYNWAIDTRLLEAPTAWSQVFTTDGHFRIWVDPAIGTSARGTHPSESETPIVSLSGQAQLRSYAERVQAARERAGFHWNTNIIISTYGPEATMSCYMRSVLALTDDEPERVVGNGYYHDTLRKVEGEWRFATRDLHIGPGSGGRVKV